MEEERKLHRGWKIALLVLTVVGLFLTVNQIFVLKIFNFMPHDNSFLYYLIAIFLPFNFIIYPQERSVVWYDLILAFLSFGIGTYLGINGPTMMRNSWELTAPLLPTIFSIALWFLILEAVRRSTGKVLAIVCLIFSLYPLIAGHMPGFLQGVQFDFFSLARMHVISRDSIVGMPTEVFGRLLIGFMIFGIVLKNTGGGDFFLKMALSLFGRFPGGPAKVACVSSALLGSLTGSVISNVVTTGAMTIPAMKKTGYPAHYAGAIEACASTGGMIMPPVMGAAAFIMASFLRIPYASIVGAAVIPAILYFWCLFVQIDAYARRNGLKGYTADQLPPLGKTLKEGWHFIFAFVLLFYFLITLRMEAWAPYYTTLGLLLLSAFRAETRLNRKKIISLLEEIGATLTMLMSLISAVGLILGALSVTGVALAFSRELVSLVGQNPILILIAGAITSFILGMGMTATACYIFLAIVMAPALTAMGFNTIASHMFIFYWGMLSYITPPMALAVYAASGIAQSNPMKTGWTAVRIGIIAFILPFFFVYNPSLLAQGSILSVTSAALTGVIGVWMLASGLEGYIMWAGNIPNLWLRVVTIISGMLLITPEMYTNIIGVIMLVILLVLIKSKNAKLNYTAA